MLRALNLWSLEERTQGGEEDIELPSLTSYRTLWKGWSQTFQRGGPQKVKSQKSQLAIRNIPAVFMGKGVTGGAVLSWKSCSRDSSLFDSGSVQKLVGAF